MTSTYSKNYDYLLRASAHNTSYAARQSSVANASAITKQNTTKRNVMSTADTELYNNKAFAHVVCKIQKK